MNPRSDFGLGEVCALCVLLFSAFVILFCVEKSTRVILPYCDSVQCEVLCVVRVQRGGSTKSSVKLSVKDCRTRYSGSPNTLQSTARAYAGADFTCRPASSRTSCFGDSFDCSWFVCGQEKTRMKQLNSKPRPARFIDICDMASPVLRGFSCPVI